MSVLFRDRREAGRRLATKLMHYAGSADVIVLALPRGGVPVGYEVAEALGAPLEVFVVRKLGVPGHEELAMGAIASGGVRVVLGDIVRQVGVTTAMVDAVTRQEERELARRERLYRGGRELRSLAGATVILVDDGVATGATVLAAVRALRLHRPRRIVVAAPVMSDEAAASLATIADEVVNVDVPRHFYGVGAWYEDFRPTSDDEVLALLAAGGHGSREALEPARDATS